jgi:polyhydroxybutyrate depolymerase
LYKKIKRKIIFVAAFLSIFLSLVFDCCKEYKQHSEITPGKFEHNCLIRDYIYYASDNLPEKAPLVVVLHGFTSNAEKIMNYSEMNTIAKENNFAVVYPQGTIDPDSNTFWNVGYDFHSDITTDDVDYIVKLVQYIQERYSLSVDNTFLTGMSNGGEMCYLLVCRHPEVFKAFAPVAGMMLQSFFDNCNLNHPIPVFAIFGTNDDITNFDGDINNNDGWGGYQSIPFTINYWAEAIKYTSVQSDTLPDINKKDSSFVVSKKYLNSQNGNEVLFYKVINGGHDWPGAWGNMDINTSKEIWKFFEKYKQ